MVISGFGMGVEYIRFSRVEIVALVRYLGLEEWVDSPVKLLGRYVRARALYVSVSTGIGGRI